MQEIAIFAAGCFWGVQHYFDQVPGVVKTMVGYIGGRTEDPTYEDVSTGRTGHVEAIKIEFDHEQVSYETLVAHLLRIHDPTQYNRQGPDVGTQYRSAIYYMNEAQLEAARQVLAQEQQEYDKPIMTEVAVAERFYPAEEYHQRFTEKTGQGGCHVDYRPQ